jgi:CRISPR-associated exonuclease Cas4
MCLEFMTGRAVPEGAIFYGESKRRRVVHVTEELRSDVVRVVSEVRQMLSSEVLPPPLSGEAALRRCKGCSLLDRCQPTANASAIAAARLLLFDPDV